MVMDGGGYHHGCTSAGVQLLLEKCISSSHIDLSATGRPGLFTNSDSTIGEWLPVNPKPTVIKPLGIRAYRLGLIGNQSNQSP